MTYLEKTFGAGAPCVHNALGNALTIELRRHHTCHSA